MDWGPISGAPLPPGREGLTCTDCLLAEWRAADIAAANAEVIVTTALLRYSNHLGPPPDKTQMDDARQLRAVATTLLATALNKLESAQMVNANVCGPGQPGDHRSFVRWGGSDWDPLGDGEHAPSCSRL